MADGEMGNTGWQGQARALHGENVSLKEYFEEKIRAIENTTSRDREVLESRLEGMNEFRDALKEQASHFVTMTQHETVLEDVRGLRESRAEMQGKANMIHVFVAYALCIVAILISVWVRFDAQAAQAAQAAQLRWQEKKP